MRVAQRAAASRTLGLPPLGGGPPPTFFFPERGEARDPERDAPRLLKILVFFCVLLLIVWRPPLAFGTIPYNICLSKSNFDDFRRQDLRCLRTVVTGRKQRFC
jgi:hypothetical protein